jgi:hypothetical protein
MLPVAAPLEHIKLAHNTRQGLRQAAASLDNKHADRRDAAPQQRKTHTGCHHSLHTGYTRTPGPNPLLPLPSLRQQQKQSFAGENIQTQTIIQSADSF